MPEYKVSIKKYRMLIFVFGGATIVLGVAFIIQLVRLNHYEPLILFPLFFNYSMWLIFGYEKLIINDETVRLIKSNNIFSISKTIMIEDIKSISIQIKQIELDENTFWTKSRIEKNQGLERAFPFWLKMGSLNLLFNKSNRSFFNGLSHDDARIMKTEIETELEKRKHNTA